uniref:Uncharacterized protein n=1 Tax=Wuchereria bancrofti TaxID=6293 RepID=A0AAF5PKY6_WUCBA
MREIIRNIYYYHPNFVGIIKFLDDQKSRGKPAVSSSSKNTVSVHLTFYLKTVRDSFIGNLLFFQLLKMQKPSDLPKCDTAGCKRWHCKIAVSRLRFCLHQFCLRIIIERRIAYNRRQCGAGMRHRDEPQLLSTTVATFSLHH